MNKMILTALTAGALSAGLIGCGVRQAATDTGTAIGSGAEAVARTGAGATRAVTEAGAGAGRAVTSAGSGAVRTVTGTSAKVENDTLAGQSVTDRDMVIYRKKGVVYHNGQAYHIKNGKYVIVR